MDIRVLDKTHQVVAVIDSYESFYWNEKFNGFGEFEIYTGMDPALLSVIQTEYYISIDGTSHGMVIESINIKTDVENGNKLIIRGRSLESILDRRIVITRTIIDSNLHDALKGVVTTAFMNPAMAWRQVNNMIWDNNNASFLVTTNVKEQFYYNNIYDIVQQTCEYYQIGFQITFDGPILRVTLKLGTDRSYDQTTNPYVVFSPVFDNLIDSDYIFTIENWKTIVYIKGDDSDGVDVQSAIQIPYGNTLPPLEKREMFIDGTSISKFTSPGVPMDINTYKSQLAQYGYREMAKDHPKQEIFNASIDTSNYTYGVDYFLGDYVQLENEYGMQRKAQIIEMTFSKNLSGFAMYPTFRIVQ